MATNLRMTEETVKAELDGIGALPNSGKLRIYDGSQPTDPDAAIGAVNLLAEFTLPADVFPAAAISGNRGRLTANAISNTTGLFAATATWFRVWKSDGTTPLWDGSVGTASADLILNSTSISVGATVSITSWIHEMPQYSGA